MLQKRPPAPQQLADVVRAKVPKNAFVKVMAMPENHPLNQCKQETRDYLDTLTKYLPNYHVAFSEVGTLTLTRTVNGTGQHRRRRPILICAR